LATWVPGNAWERRDCRGDTDRSGLYRRRLPAVDVHGKRRADEAVSGTVNVPVLDRDAPLQFLMTAFHPDDWVAIFLKSYETGRVTQRVGPLDWVMHSRFQAWLRFKNLSRFNVYCGVNAIAPWKRKRTRESIGAVRHVFLEADHDGPLVLARI